MFRLYEDGGGSLFEYVLIPCVILVLLMQAGFLCFEAGLTREKNSTNVAAKNLVDLIVSFLGFWVIGRTLVHGESWNGLLGLGFSKDAPSALKTIIAGLFCATAVTIISGALAERMRFVSYISASLIVGVVIYPVSAHWIWNPSGWLNKAGFIDLAGSTAVHSVGAWVALSALLIVGSRLGRFQKDANPITGSSYVTVMLGTLLLFVGWFGFNLASGVDQVELFPVITINTFLGAMGGGLGGILTTRFRTEYFRIERVTNGIITGLVSVTAGAHLFSANTSILVGFSGSLLGFLGSKLLIRYRIDDAVDAVPVHLVGGIWGTLCVGFMASKGGSFHQTSIQLLGVVSVGAWAFLSSFVIFKILDRFLPFRVDKESEMVGLNVSEHNTPSLTTELSQTIIEHSKSLTLKKRARVEPFTDIGTIASHYNVLLDRLEGNIRRVFNQNQNLVEVGLRTAGILHDLKDPIHIMRAGSFRLRRYKDRLSVEEIDEIANSFEGQIVRVNAMAESILVKIHGKSSGKFENISIRELIQDCYAVLGERLKDNHISFVLPVDHEVSYVFGVQQEILRAVVNLVNNAIDAICLQDSSSRWIEVKTSKSNDVLKIQVLDSGSGVPEELVERIFSDLFTNKDTGTGLGLTNIQMIMREHSGRVFLEKRVNPTTFTLEFPVNLNRREKREAS